MVSTKYTQLQKQVQDYHRQVKAALAQAGFIPRPPMDLSTPLEPAAWIEEDDPRMGRQWRKLPSWAAGGVDPPRP
jgi:hypothetical protein